MFIPLWVYKEVVMKKFMYKLEELMEIGGTKKDIVQISDTMDLIH